MPGWAGIARFGGIGDHLIAASVLRPLRRLGYKTEVITSGRAAAVFLNNPYIDKLSVQPAGDIPAGEAGTRWFVSRAREYDLFAHLSYSCEVRHALQVNQPQFWWRPEYRRRVCAGSYLETAHDIVGVAHEFGPVFFPSEDEAVRAARVKEEVLGGRYVAWVLAGSRVDKAYPYAAMAIGRIIRELGVSVLMVGEGGTQSEITKERVNHVRRQNGDVRGLHSTITAAGADPGGHEHWSIRRSLSQTLAADVVVSPDTGAAWAVAMEAMPKVMMVSHASVENITKHWVNTVTLHCDVAEVPCWPCHRLHNDISTCTPAKDLGHAAACMADISVELIVTAVKAALGDAAAGAAMWASWPTRVS
jgi:hypothetical protein